MHADEGTGRTWLAPRDWPGMLRNYAGQDARADLVSGLTVAVMGVPQAMAYAMLAGVPPVYGLYTAIIGCIVGSLFGSSSHLVTGPTNASSMLIFTITRPYIDTHDPIEVVLLLTFITGAVKALFGFIRLGGVVRYVSNSVVTGLTAGAGVLIAGNQIKNVMGVRIAPQATEFYEVMLDTFAKAGNTNWYAVGIGLFTAGVVMGAKRIDRRIPGPLLGVTMATLIVYAFKLHGENFNVGILRNLSREPMSSSLAIFHWPEYLRLGNLVEGLRLGQEIFTGALAIAILGLVEAASSSRAVAASSGQRLNFNREFVGQGFSNIIGAFFLNFVGSGSFTRTALAYQSGGRTRMAPAFSGMFTALTVVALAPLANFIPTASLAGMLIVIAYSMIEKHRLKLALSAGANSRIVLIVTFCSTLIFSLQHAIFIGVFMSIVFLLKITGKADLTILVPRENGRFDEVPHGEAPAEPVVIVNMEGDLYFAAVENLDYQLKQVLTPQTRVLILRMKRLRAVGSSAMAILEHFHEMLGQMHVSLVVSGIEKSLAGMMNRSGLREKIGEQNIFYADNTLFQSTELALARARGILQMERRRTEDLRKTEPTCLVEMSGVSALHIMSRQCIRFGQNHSVREAVWLLSEMNERMGTGNTEPLFLQDEHGKLSAELTPWRLLEELLQGLTPENLAMISDEEMGGHFARAFSRPISQIANHDLPRCETGTPLSRLLLDSVLRDMRVLPVRDGEGRVIGRVTQDALVTGLGRALGFSV